MKGSVLGPYKGGPYKMIMRVNRDIHNSYAHLSNTLTLGAKTRDLFIIPSPVLTRTMWNRSMIAS